MNKEVCGENDLKKSRNIGIVALIIIFAAIGLLLLGAWRWSIVTFLPGVAGMFLSLAFREDRQSGSSWLITMYVLFGGAFVFALLVKIIYVITRG